MSDASVNLELGFKDTGSTPLINDDIENCLTSSVNPNFKGVLEGYSIDNSSKNCKGNLSDTDLSLLLGNEYGCLRWSLIRSAYYGNLISENDIVDIYKEWKDTSEFLILKVTAEIRIPSLTPEGSGQLGYHSFYKFMKAAKRGNDVYKALVQRKFNVLNGIEPIMFFERDWKVKVTNLLFVTLTYGRRACDDCGKHFKKSLCVCPYCKSTNVHSVAISEAWDKIGVDFNRFVSNVKKKYGDISILRTWEAHDSFYPHIHAIIAFHNHDFPVFVQKLKNGNKYRIPTNDKMLIRGYWHSPNVDIQGVANTQEAVKEVSKYITKDLCSDKGHKTAAMLSLFNKQSYSISKNFVEFIGGTSDDAKKLKQEENALLLSNMYNSNQGIIEYEFIGMLPAKMLGVSSDIMGFELDKPPPDVQKMIDYEHECYLAKHRGR